MRSAEPLPTDLHQAAEAAAMARVPDPARGGPTIRTGDGPLPPFTGVDRGLATYAGSTACLACHPAAAATWSSSAHHHALETLVVAQKAYDPSCLRCHTIGFGHPGGYGAGHALPELTGVGCESCHGPGSEHLQAPGQGYGVLAPGPESCIGCHTHDNSPDFRWETYWPRVSH